MKRIPLLPLPRRLRLAIITLALPLCCTLSISAATAQTSTEAPPAGFLFVTFKGEQNALTEQIYFAVSEDGRTWNALHDGQPVLVSQLGEKGVRDPYLLRSRDGRKFYLMATDLSFFDTRNKGGWKQALRAGSKSIVIWESPDLVTWSEPRLVKVAPDDAGCTWAPEAIYDEEAGDYLVFWASTTAADDFQKHRIWAARTKDFISFSPPFLYIDKPTAIIDTTIVRDGNGYHRFTKDEQYKVITMESAPRLSGPWSEVPSFSLAKLVGYEGPEIYQLEPAQNGRSATWCLILDHYSKGQGYQPWTTTSLASGDFQSAEGFKFPFKFRHGSILPLTAAELSRLHEWTTNR